jgi:alkanesulfonate monooxygenase SsuD/methylene tetrahydromethanopterin reductase-like flavin-dependent oxidoreductase (luciferase family)
MGSIVYFGTRVKVRGKEDWSHPFCTAYGKKGHRVRLMPGANLVRDEDLKALMENKSFKADIQAGILRVQEIKGREHAKLVEQETMGDFEKVPQASLMAAIPDMLDTALLTRIAREDKRNQVKGAAKRRLDEILGAAAGQGDGVGG